MRRRWLENWRQTPETDAEHNVVVTKETFGRGVRRARETRAERNTPLPGKR